MRRRTFGTLRVAVALAVPLAAQATTSANAATPVDGLDHRLRRQRPAG